MSILKFIFGILFLPLVVSFTIGLSKELLILERSIIYFIWGIISYLIFHLFICKPIIIYQKGQKILEIIFRFFSPLIKIASYLLPIYTIILFFLYFVLSLFIKDGLFKNYFLSLFSFTLSFHLILTADILRKKEDLLKANYIFGFSLIYILNLLLFSFGLSLVFDRFSFLRFFNGSLQIAKDTFSAILKQLFS